jgi:hypothetical protein
MQSADSARLVLLLLILCIHATRASACMCGSAYHGKTPWELAKLEAKGAPAIFEGVPVRFKMRWGMLDAKDGEMVPADFPGEKADDWPQMVVTFRVQKIYKGNFGAEVEIVTGLGGGDCGARYLPGLTYLVYGSETDFHALHTSMCTPGGWIGSSNISADLRYLRGKHPISTDLTLSRNAWTKGTPDQERQRGYEEFKKRYESATGAICGAVVQEGVTSTERGSISFLSVDGYSPVEHPVVRVTEDGTFCSDRLGPGKYYLYFTNFSDKGPTCAIFYPGVSEREQATAVEVTAGQERSGLLFTISMQQTYSVRGVISVDDKSRLGANDISVSLMRVEGDRQSWYRQPVDFSGSLPLPKVRFFSFKNIPPGHYVAFASASNAGWLTKKVNVDLSTHMKIISLELMQKH